MARATASSPIRGPAGHVFPAVKLAEHDTHTGAAPIDEEQKQVHHRPRHAHGGKGGVPHKAAHDDRVDGVIQLLQDVAHQQGSGQGGELGADISLGEMVGVHGVSLRLLFAVFVKGARKHYFLAFGI